MSVEGVGTTAKYLTGLLAELRLWRPYIPLIGMTAFCGFLMMENRNLNMESKVDQKQCSANEKRLLERVIEEKQESNNLLRENKAFLEADNDRLRRNQTNNDR